jgi:hypothetical protein
MLCGGRSVCGLCGVAQASQVWREMVKWDVDFQCFVMCGGRALRWFEKRSSGGNGGDYSSGVLFVDGGFCAGNKLSGSSKFLHSMG